MNAFQLVAIAAAVVIAIAGVAVPGGRALVAWYRARLTKKPITTVTTASPTVDHTVFNIDPVSLKEYLLLRGPASFHPVPFYSATGDFISMFWADELAYSETVAPGVSVYRSTKTKEIVGFKLLGVKAVLAEGDPKPVPPAPQ